MGFNEFFLDYKLLIRRKISFAEFLHEFRSLPKRSKIIFTIFFILIVLMLIFSVLQYVFNSLVCTRIAVSIAILIVILLIIAISLNETRDDLENVLKPAALRNRSILISLLNQYGIHPDDTEKIKSLISEAESVLSENDPFLQMKTPVKIIFAAAASIFGFLMQQLLSHRVMNENDPKGAIILAGQILCIIVLLVSLGMGLAPNITDILYRNKKYYKKLIYELRQLTLFP